MQVALTQLERPLGRKLSISLPPESYSVALSRRLSELSKSVSLKGFRPGKVPASVIEQRFGAQVRSEVAEQLVRDALGNSIQQHALRLAVDPSVRFVQPPSLASFEFEAEFDVMPEVGLIDVSALQVTRIVSVIEDADIDRMIDNLRLQRRSWNNVERAGAKGDLVAFEMVVTVDGERYPAEGSERAATVLGSGVVVPEVESALEGRVAGDALEASFAYPESHRDPKVAGKTAQAEVRVVQVQEPQLPEVDADFVQSFGIVDGDIETFRREVRNNLEREMRGALSQRLRVEVINKLIAAHSSFELPESLVQAEAQRLRAMALQQAKNQGAQIDQEPAIELFMNDARARVRGGLLIGEVAQQNGLKLDQRRVRDAVETIASTYEDPASVVKMYREDQRLLAAVQERVMEEQVADWVAERAQTTEEPRAFVDLLK
ncbi:MAG: trigger factor [Xanthomonadales bacterium]|jgi:trigger factor|nr:trigger factor [Xanthomonadales bacterium]